MPRLLLVDDNPSIHRIAESLLTGTTVDLVCVESAEEALRRLNAGEHFDVALLDTVLGPGGMDGWALLERLRQTPATEKLPIALMAGVLDAVDPLRLEKAPIQGFLRKPIELRDLEERLHAYMAAPVEGVGRGTVPGAKLQDWMSEAPAAPAPARGPEPENDLLVLTAEDLLEPDLQAETHEPELHLEDFDMDTLHGVTLAPPGAAAASGVVSTPSFDAPVSHPEPDLPQIPSLNLDEPLSHEMLAGLAPMAVASVQAPEPVSEMQLETLHGVEPEALQAKAPEAAAWAMAAVSPEPSPVPASAPSIPAAMPGDAHALVQAILADPGARQALLKALLSQGGEQVLREVAWEVMPDLAAKLQK
ncbi:MAG TPA: response regulator [Holophagaceae bacterium]|nr:response regulator [Holophagaceae bacterium]